MQRSGPEPCPVCGARVIIIAHPIAGGGCFTALEATPTEARPIPTQDPLTGAWEAGEPFYSWRAHRCIRLAGGAPVARWLAPQGIQ